MDPVTSDQLRVIVEMGDDYQPSDRVAAALTELSAALSDEADDVAGFGLIPVRSFLFDSMSVATGDGSVFPKVEIFNKAEEFNKASSIWKW